MIFGGEYIGHTLALNFDSSVAFLMPLMLCAYLGIVFGVVSIFLYFYGMQLFALGRIAYNTEKNPNIETGKTAKKASAKEETAKTNKKAEPCVGKIIT